jgi:hypothetical protein
VGRGASQSVRWVRFRARLDKRSTGRLLFAGLGFAVAYFLDAAQGRARRKQVADVFRRVRRSELTSDAVKDDRAVADLPRIGWADTRPRATFQRAADGIRLSGRA